MIYAHVFTTEHDARLSFYEFVTPRVDSAKWIDGSCFRVRMVKLNNGEEHHFMPEREYHKWCMGRTYEMDGKLYHSGYPLERSKEND